METSARIAYVGPLPPIRGGIAQHGANLVTALRDSGAVVDAWSWQRQYPPLLYPGTERDPGVDFPDAEYLLRWWDPTSWVGVGRRARHADAVVFPWVTPFHALPLRTIQNTARTRSIAVIHNAMPHDSHIADRPLTSIGLARVDGVICHTEEAAQQMRHLLPSAEIRLAAHPPNLKIERSAAPAPPPPLRLLMPGFVRPYKGLFDAIDAVGIATAAGLEVTLTVAGDFWSPSIDAAQAAVDAHGLGEAVTLEPGYLPDERLQELIAACHAVVLPYRDATQSGLIPLSLASGRPVITSDAGGLTGQVRPGVNAVVSHRGDATSLAEAIGTLAADYDRYASATGIELPSWDDMASAVLSLARPV